MSHCNRTLVGLTPMAVKFCGAPVGTEKKNAKNSRHMLDAVVATRCVHSNVVQCERTITLTLYIYMRYTDMMPKLENDHADMQIKT